MNGDDQCREDAKAADERRGDGVLLVAAGLVEAGVARDHVDAAPPCTRCEATRFFSYRRDGRDGGVHMGFIGLV